MTSKMAPDVTIWFKILFFLGLFSVSSSLEWTSSVELPDNFTIAACAGQDVTLAWAYNLTANESVIDVEWLFRPKEDTAADVIATWVHGHFFTEVSSGANMQFIPVAGIRLQGVSPSDSGIYSIHVNVNVQGISTVSQVQSVNVDVTSTSLTTDGQLQVHMIGARYLNSTQQHHIILTCGIFNALWVPRVNVLWTTPMNQTVTSTFEENGQFELAVPNPFVSGEYTCTIDKSSPASLCVASNSNFTSGATVMVDGTEGRISLMASELQMTTSKLQVTERELHATESELHTTGSKLQATESKLQATESRLQATESEVRALQHNISSLQTENVVLKANITDIQSQLVFGIRLVGGSRAEEGRVEVFINGQWGTVCDDNWNGNNAKVVCRQLGYAYSNAQAFTGASFGAGSGPIHLDDVSCDGSEVALSLCRRSPIDHSNCNHNEDAGVHCA